MLWLLVIGVNVERWNEKAGATMCRSSLLKAAGTCPINAVIGKVKSYFKWTITRLIRS
jgi:hypothetical protein